MYYGKTYKTYSKLFNKEKAIGNIQQGVRKLTKKQYDYYVRNEKVTNKIILEKQVILTQKQKKKVWSDYKKEYLSTKKRGLKPGDKTIQSNTFWGKDMKNVVTGEDLNGVKYHRTLGGLLRDKSSTHFVIAARIDNGEVREEVLSDYGY